MKTSVRFLSLILAVVMIAGMALTASADNNDKIANEEALDFLVNLGVFGGYDDGSLKPNDLVKRSEMAKIVFVLYTTFSEAGVVTEGFSDVPADNWAAGYISWCAANSIIGGYGDGRFGPDDNITYDQALKMVCGALGYKDWDSRFWPTDVRRTALTTLKLGENLEDVKGSDYVTRAQIAQIVYNALYADMKETKKNEGGFAIPMVLISDVWNVKETEDTVVATEKLYVDYEYPTNEKDEIILDDLGLMTLEELGLEKYNGKTDELIKARVNVIKRNDEIIGTTVKSVFEKNVKITENEDGDIFLNGEKLKEEDANALVGISIDKTGKVKEVPFTVPSKDLAYVSLACDVDADGTYDWIEWNNYSAYEVKTIGKKTTTFSALEGVGTGDDKIVNNENVVAKASYAEENVVVVIDRKYAVEVVAVVTPITASVTKLGNGKIALAGADEYTVNKKVFKNVDALALTNSIMSNDAKGNRKTFDFYVYDGQVFYAPEARDLATENSYAILAYVNDPTEPVLDAELKEFSSVYSAVLVIDGKEVKVDLDPDETIIDAKGNAISIVDEYAQYQAYIEGGKKEEDKDKIFALYGKKENIEEGYLQAEYTLVTYKVVDNKYTLKLVEKDMEGYTVLKEGATITVDPKNGILTIVGKTIDGDDFNEQAVVGNATAMYYSYLKDETKLHKYLGVYTASNLYEEFKPATTSGYTYLVKEDKDQLLYTLEATMLSDKLEEVTIGGDYKTDARLLKYCYSGSSKEFLVDESAVFSAHFLMDIPTLKNSGEVFDMTKSDLEAETLSSKRLYAYDEEEKKYVEIKKDMVGLDCISVANVKSIVNGCIITDSGDYVEGVKIPESAVLWTFSVSANGDKSTSGYKQLTLDEIAASLKLRKDRIEDGETLGEMRAMFFTYENAKGEKQISSVYVDFWSESANGNLFTHAGSTYNDFIGAYDSDWALK